MTTGNHIADIGDRDWEARERRRMELEKVECEREYKEEGETMDDLYTVQKRLDEMVAQGTMTEGEKEKILKSVSNELSKDYREQNRPVRKS